MRIAVRLAAACMFLVLRPAPAPAQEACARLLNGLDVFTRQTNEKVKGAAARIEAAQKQNPTMSDRERGVLAKHFCAAYGEALGSYEASRIAAAECIGATPDGKQQVDALDKAITSMRATIEKACS